VKPDDVAEAFVKANPGLSRAAFAVACDSKRLSEVRVCLNKDFSFRDCAEVAHRAYKRDSIAMPAVRGRTASKHGRLKTNLVSTIALSRH